MKLTRKGLIMNMSLDPSFLLSFDIKTWVELLGVNWFFEKYNKSHVLDTYIIYLIV